MQPAIRSSGKSRMGAIMAAFLGMGDSFPLGALDNMIAQPGFRAHKYRVSRQYPEQSSRQAVRGARRQQGGNGIILTSEFQYVER